MRLRSGLCILGSAILAGTPGLLPRMDHGCDAAL
jgi:hypothetical protein